MQEFKFHLHGQSLPDNSKLLGSPHCLCMLMAREFKVISQIVGSGRNCDQNGDGCLRTAKVGIFVV